MKRTILLLAILSTLSACATRIASMSVISDKTIETRDVKVSKLPRKENVVGESKRFQFLFIPFGRPSVKQALDDALAKGNGDLMLDVALYQTSWWFIIGRFGYEIKGAVVDTRGGNE